MMSDLKQVRHLKRLRRTDKGQTALETAFVLGGLLFLTFAFVNLAILLHTKNIATYAAFMSARSFQVLGDQTGQEAFKEKGQGGQQTGFLSDLGENVVAAYRVAEDVYTCALPWMSVPKGDEKVQFKPDPNKPILAHERCLEGKRKYQSTNVAKALNFQPFKKDDGTGSEEKSLDEVPGSFVERTGSATLLNPNAGRRDPLRYGILVLKFRTPLLFNPGNILRINGEDAMVRDEVYVPVLLNQGLSAVLKKKDEKSKDFSEAEAGN